MDADIRATAYHEAGHAVVAIALGHELEYVRFEPRGGRYPGLTHTTGPLPRDTEECVIIKLAGGVAECKHDSGWKPTPYGCNDDIADARRMLSEKGYGERMIDAVMSAALPETRALMDCAGLWTAIAELAEYLAGRFPADALKPTRFSGGTLAKFVASTVPEAEMAHCATEIRAAADRLRAVRC